MKIDPTVSWMQERRPASHWEKSRDGSAQVICNLSPRHCRIDDGQTGHCGVRGNVGGELFTFNYGKSVEATMEFIETEAVNHFRPGAKILSLGNIGCMMSCDFCQNWRTSQVRHLDPAEVRRYSPQDIIDTCKMLGIKVISWTYNDPVVWHEFVVETSRMAQREGIATLYKSAFYIETEAVDELIDCIDIFSISLKSIEDRFYRKFTGGAHLQPILDMIRRVHASGRHLEISQLLVTDRNDAEEETRRTNAWILENLGDRVPLHYVAFHPAYLYMATTRTPPEVVLRARQLALEAGIKYCYAGNMFREGVADTRCPACGATTVSRFGLNARPVGLRADGCCSQCGTQSDVKDPLGGVEPDASHDLPPGATRSGEFLWHREANSVHIEVGADPASVCPIRVERLGTGDVAARTYFVGGILRRIIVSRQTDDETGIRVTIPDKATFTFYPVLDRAHFPVSEDIDSELSGYRKDREAMAAHQPSE